MPQITIDGQPLEVPEGITVLRAAEMHGISIPKLCDFAHLTPYGGCRLCVVEVEGTRMLQTSCTLPVFEGMQVRTDTPRVHEARRMVLGMLFSERNHFCMYCQVSGADCDLQNAALREEMTHWPMQPAWKSFPVDASHPYFVLDNNRCILCRRCVRACGELVGNHTLGIQNRGADALLVADAGLPLGESTCIRCGTCLQVCPTGALMDRYSTYRGLQPQTEAVQSICLGCSVGCGVLLRTRDNHLLRIESNWEAPVNSGLLCEDGRFKPLYRQEKRLHTPLLRRNGTQKPATWEEALHVITGRMASSVPLAALISTRQPNESMAAFIRLFRDTLQADVVTSIEEGYVTHPRLEASLATRRRATLKDLQDADCVLVLGADLSRKHQVAGFLIRRRVPEHLSLITCTREESPLDAQADVILRDESDLRVLRALMGEAESPPQAAAAARLLESAQKAVIIVGRGFTSHATIESVEALLELARRFDARLLPLYGKANSRAAIDYGLQTPFDGHGMQAACIFLGDDSPHPALLQRLEGVPFVLVQAAYESELTRRADVVLPAATWEEQSGHYINLQGNLQKAQAAIRPPAGIPTVLETLQRLHAAMRG